MSTERDEFRQEVRAWLARSIPAEWRERDDSMDDAVEVELRRAWGKQVYADGFAGLDWPTEYGGRGLGAAEVAIYYEECALAHAPEPLNRLGLNLAGPAILDHGTEEQRRKYLPGIIGGQDIWCEGFSEPNAGSDLAAVTTTARRDGDRWLISGTKIWTSLAHLADYCYLLARTSPDAPRHQNLTVFLVDLRQPGVEIVPLRHLTGVAEFNEVRYDEVVVTDADVLGTVNDGWRLGTVGSNAMRSSHAATTGWHHHVRMQEWLDQYRDCLAEMGRDGGADLVDLEDRLAAQRHHMQRLVSVMHDKEEWLQPVGGSFAGRLHWSKLYQRICDRGYELGCPHHRAYWRDAYLDCRAASIYGGSLQLQRNVIADQVLGLRKR